MADDDKDMFDSAMLDDAASEPATIEQPLTEQPERAAPEGDRSRDEKGRFAPKDKSHDEVAEQAAPPSQTPSEVTAEQTREREQGIPPWRLREEAEARRAAEQRAMQHEQELAQMRQAMAQLQEQSKPKTPAPDIFEDPSAFVDHGVRSAIDPVKSEISQLREFYSQREAVREHGAEKVKAAYDAIAGGLRAGDPEAKAVYQRAMQSMDPYGDIMKWHTKQTLFSQIGTDPNAWFEKQMEERMKDAAFQSKILERIRGQAQQRPSATQIPPSLNRATTASAPPDDDDDGTEAGLLKSALRR